MKKSLEIILKQYKKGHITDEEIMILIEDLYNKPSNNWWWTTSPSYPSITEPVVQPYTVTCNENNSVSKMQ